MSADRLREAARVLRERAEGATYIVAIPPELGVALADWLEYESARISVAAEDGRDALLSEVKRIADLILGSAS